jgi:predicted ribosome quality control (RQC) complex YloA/Tae2 family protein
VVIVGRDKRENDLLEQYAHMDDYCVKFADNIPGPFLLMKIIGKPNEEIFSLAGGLIQRYSKLRNQESHEVVYYKRSEEKRGRRIFAKKISDEEVKAVTR